MQIHKLICIDMDFALKNCGTQKCRQNCTKFFETEFFFKPVGDFDWSQQNAGIRRECIEYIVVRHVHGLQWSFNQIEP